MIEESMRWSNYVFERGLQLTRFWTEHLKSGDRSLLFVLAKGFDPRMCLGLGRVLQCCSTTTCNVVLLDYDEGRNSASQIYRDAIDENLRRLNEAIGNRGNIYQLPLDVLSQEGRRIMSRSALNAFNSLNDFRGATDVILDISSCPRGIYLPMAAKILHLLDSNGDQPAPNFHVLVWEDWVLDAEIKDAGVDEMAEYIPGFSGGMEREANSEQPNVWIPILGEHQRPQLERIYNLIEPDEICPVLPSPAHNPRRGDALVADYHQLLFDSWGVEPRNIIYGSEQNPFDVYRQIMRTVQLYRESFKPLGNAKFVLSALSSKLLSMGALLAAYDFRRAGFPIAFAHVGCQGYTMPPGASSSSGDLCGMWLAGEFEQI
jgi:hypothetical protein